MRAHLPVLLLLLTCVLRGSPLQAQDTAIRYLSGTDKDTTVPWDFMVTDGRRAGTWTTIPVPSNWELHGFGTYNYGQEKNKADERGHYRHRFDVPGAWRGRRIVLVFEGAMTDTEVRVNGRSAGPVHQGGFYEFSYDVTRLLRPGRSNLLEVTVSKQSANASINRAERDGDFWVFGGIYRPVYLAAFPSESIDRAAIDARADGTFGVDVYLAGVTAATHVAGRIETLEGSPVGEPFEAAVAAGQAMVTLRTRIEAPRTWNAEDPALYRVRLRLQRGAATLHAASERFGFRTIEVRPGDGIYVNGARIVLQGVNRHTFWPDSGRTTSATISVADVQLMKDMNMNAVRMSHYPPDEHFLDACDELGLYVLDELTGWQAKYDTDVGERLVGQLVRRDVNHPSILFWNNGNEGGFNTDLDDDYAKWDPQQRLVLHPWDVFNGIDTLHYAPYGCCAGQFFQGRHLILPTEFMHGLYDGGHGAGLRDYWTAIVRHPLGAGGFLWVLADEGVVRTDREGQVDPHLNFGPDGIVGPYREKEASFFTIKQLWSQVWIDVETLSPAFDGRLPVENRYGFTNLDRCSFSWELLTMREPADREPGHAVARRGTPAAPAVPPGARGVIDLNLPADWRSFDALAVTARDPSGRELYTWRWMLKAQAEVASRVVSTSGPRVTGREEAGRIVVTAGRTVVAIDRATARLASVAVDGQAVSFANGPRAVPGDSTVTALTHGADGDAYLVEATLDGTLRNVRWRVHGSGWVTLDYALRVRGGEYPSLGVTFDYPETKVTGVRWLGRGPHRVWKNRLDGVTHDVWDKPFNDGETGVRWTYPEFKGFYADLHWATIRTTEAPVTIVTETEGMFLRLLTPRFPEDARFAQAPFPEGNVSLLHGIPPIGTKFHAASVYGPQSQLNLVNGRTGTYAARVHLYFGELPQGAPAMTR